MNDDRREAETARVLRALSDPHRRAMLDALRQRDGRSVTELGERLPGLGRHAVLKHLGVLEDAGLVTTRKVGRQRLAHLNPVPVVALARRWLDDFGARMGLTLTGLRDLLETPEHQEPPMTETVTRVATVVVAASPEQIWAAMTDPHQTVRYYHGTEVHSTWEVGARIEYRYPGGPAALEGEILEIEPGRRLVHTFHAVWDDTIAADAPTRYECRLEPAGDGLTRVTVEHSQVVAGSVTDQQTSGGHEYVLSALKTLVETGRSIDELAATAAR
ncbi:ArsR/SmtB family transcription factor [Thalassiella azotivora]